MHFLVSNDDGHQAPGIHALAEALSELGKVTVVAPDRDRSGASNSLTLDAPLHVNQDARGYFYVNGTPTDCVHLAITGLMDEEPDMVISGINAGGNLGDDVLYSGTVAAAMEGRFLGRPAIAFSQTGDNPIDYSNSVKVVIDVVKLIMQQSIAEDTLLNINLPQEYPVKGYQVTRLGNRHKSEPALEARDPRGRRVYWVGPVGAEQDAGEGTDFYAVRNGYVSITPLQVDLTKHQMLDNLKQVMSELG